jgi:lysylphosphatidylglycerol synthetase-like protein (DUF2156 family)
MLFAIQGFDTAGVRRRHCVLHMCPARRYNRVAVWATGEPLAARVDWRPLTEAFLKEFPHAYFYHITEEYAELLHDMGYWINGCGTETTLQVGLAHCKSL